MRASFYADDVALFINQVGDEIVVVQAILSRFGEISGLHANFQKCVAYPVSCDHINLEQILDPFGGATGSLPCRHLGLPLSLKKPRRVDEQLLVDKIASRLSHWNGRKMRILAGWCLQTLC